MPGEHLHIMDLPEFRQFFPVFDTVGFGDDFFISELRYDGSHGIFRSPCRFDGYAAFFCVSGKMTITINLREFEVVENSLFISIPGNILMITDIPDEEKERLGFVVVAISREYMSNLKLDMNRLFSEGMLLFRNPSFVLDEEEKLMARKYLNLAEHVLKSTLLYKRDCIGSLLSSIFYLAGGVVEKHIAAVSPEDDPNPARRNRIFEKFLSLVIDHHMTEKNVGFYAERLGLTPKYLSKQIKEASGQSAPEWIDAYVILEAKNMLKYSDMTIKEIVSRLNFPSQSVFHRFFKAKTGITPHEYRKG